MARTGRIQDINTIEEPTLPGTKPQILPTPATGPLHNPDTPSRSSQLYTTPPVTMRFTVIGTLLASSLAALVSAQSPGEGCRQDGTYACSWEYDQILVCQLGTWRLAALCNGPCNCAQPTGLPVPYCNC